MPAAETARLIASLELDPRKFSRGVSTALGGIGRLETRMGRIGKIASQGASAAGRNIEKGVVLGVTAAAGALTYAVKSAVDWESAIAGINKTVEGTPAQLQAIADGIRAISRTTPIAANDLAAIAETAGALGIARDDILEFTRVVALIGTTTNVTTDEAATALGQLQNVLGLTGADLDNFASSLVALGNDGASTESQILEIARRAGASAKLFGIAKDETLGWAAAAANLGIESELAGTSLQSVFIKLLPKYTAGSKALQDITGQTAAQLKQSFEVDASGAVEALVAKLGSIPKDARLAAVQKLFGKNAGITRLVLGLADSYDRNLKPALGLGTRAWEENTAAAAEAAKRYKTTESALIVFKNNIKDVAVTIGSALLPQLAELAKEGSSFAISHQSEIKQFAKDLATGFRDVAGYLKNVNWDAVGSGLKAGATGAKLLVDAFLGAPPWLQGFLATGFVANKFTGGAVVSITTELGKGLLGGFANSLARAGIGKAFVQPVFVTNAGFGAGAGGGSLPAGGGAVAGAAKTGISTLGKVFLIGEAIGLVAAVAGVANAVSEGTTKQAQDIHTALTDALAKPQSLTELQTKLAAIDTGIARLPHDPLGGWVTSGAMSELQGMRADVVAAISAQRVPLDNIRDRAETNRIAIVSGITQLKDTSRTLSATEQAKLAAVRSAVEANRIAAVSAQRATTSQTRSSGVGIIGAIRALDLQPVVHVTVPVTVRSQGSYATATFISRATRLGIY